MPISISMYYPVEVGNYSAKNTDSELFLCRGRGGGGVISFLSL